MTFGFVFESVAGTEWLVLLGVVLIVVGPKNLPSAARKLGQIMSTLRRAADEFKRQLMAMDQEVRQTVEREINSAVETDSEADAQTQSETGADEVPDDVSGLDEAGDMADYYGDDNPYPGHEGYYDETTYEDVNEPSDPSSDETAVKPDAPKAPPSDDALRAIKITVSTDDSAGKGSAS